MRSGAATFILSLWLFSCTPKVETANFDAVLAEPCMIVNRQQDNTIEGDYLMAGEVLEGGTRIRIKMPDNFFLHDSNCTKWLVGWGTGKPYYDAGVENLRTLLRVDRTNNLITLGDLKRGAGYPAPGQKLVFWNTQPSGFSNRPDTPVINPSIWPRFSGRSVNFSSVEFDSLLNKWVMIVNEVEEHDTDSIQIFAAISDNLTQWTAANNGNPILTVADFASCNWSGKHRGKIPQTPFVSDIVRQGQKWYLFLDGYSADGKRHIGIAVSEKSLTGPYTISKAPVLSPGKKGSWDDRSVFYAKVEKYRDGFILFYDGRNTKGEEKIGKATSKDLVHWKKSAGNPVLDQHTGWSSNRGATEPAYVEVRKDSLLLMVAGVKGFKTGWWHHYVTGQINRGRPGNVDDAQLGLYLSMDGGESFVAHRNNPVFTNDYSSLWQNEHLGANFWLIRTDTADFIFYQAKSSHKGAKYNIMLRERKKQ